MNFRRTVRATVALAALALISLPTGVRADSGRIRTVSEQYSVPSNYEIDPPLGWLGGESDGTVFSAHEDEDTVTISVRDATRTWTPFVVSGVRGEAWPFVSHVYCGSATLAIQPGGGITVYPMSLFVNGHLAAGMPACPGLATHGKIDATFFS
jgi:hypothetical protein